MSEVLVTPGRLDRWTSNFLGRHGATTLNTVDGALVGFAGDGSWFEARLPFGRRYVGPATTEAFEVACAPPDDWGLLLVRKGGFAVARLNGSTVLADKVGQRHVQGRTKAGGWSQKRYARRRDQQAEEAYRAAADHATRVLADTPALVVGGDRVALETVLSRTGMTDRVVARLADVREPRRGVFEEALLDASAVTISVTNA